MGWLRKSRAQSAADTGIFILILYDVELELHSVSIYASVISLADDVEWRELTVVIVRCNPNRDGSD